MAAIRLPAYLKWRDGRPRWEPGPKLRGKGWKGRDLKSEGGQWLGLEAAIEAAKAINAEVAAAAGKSVRPAKGTRKARSCRQLWEMFEASPRFLACGARTRRDYQIKARVFLDEFGDEPVAAIAKSDLHSWWEELYRERGHAMANGVIAVARLALSYACMKDWRPDNPAKQLGLLTVAPRVVVWSPSEIAALVAAADTHCAPGIGDGIMLALHTGQRLGDILALEPSRIEGGRAVFRQGKTGARVAVPLTPQIEARLAAIRARNAAGTIVQLGGKLVRDEHGRDYTRERYSEGFRAARAKAAIEHPAVAGKMFLDLRDTAVTRLALAGCTVPEIRAITGHTLETVHQVLQHYLALDDRMADSAITRLKAWMTEEGIAL